MIRVNRTEKPEVLQRNAEKWLGALHTAIRELEQTQNNPESSVQEIRQAEKKRKKARNKYSHPEIKKALVKMFHGKCAYCESQVTVVTYGHIEHFYPKGNPDYTEKTFEWENLLLSCDICNNVQHKGIKFPLDENGDPLLIDPSDGETNPAAHLKFFWDTGTDLAWVCGTDARGEETERTFDFNGLNGRKELIRERSVYVKKLLIILKYAQNGDAEALAILKDACQDDAPYLAFAQTYIRHLISEDLTEDCQ